MSEVGFAMARLIVTTTEVAAELRKCSLTRLRELGERLSAALKDVGVDDRRQQRAEAEALMNNPPIRALEDKVPMVLYFATLAHAEDFAAIVKSVMTTPVEIELPRAVAPDYRGAGRR